MQEQNKLPKLSNVDLIISAVFTFLIIRFGVTLFNFITDPRLKIAGKQYDDLVSILIPVRNEEKNILTLLRSIEKQNYNNYEVIIIDDSSTDNTYNLSQSFAAEHPRFKVIKGKELPIGWLGKNYACHQLAQMAKGQFLLFIDADEKVFDSLINSALHRVHLNGLCLLSLFTNQEMPTFGEKLVIPVMNFFLLNLLPLRLILTNRRTSLAVASGQFMLFNAETYHQNNWHERVKNKVVEDVEIMRLIKSDSLKGETLLANGMISCRMYNNYNTAIDGFSKNLFAGFNYNIIGFLAYLLLVICGPILIFFTFKTSLIILMLGLVILSRVLISVISQQSIPKNILLHPLQMMCLLIVGVLSIQKHFTKKTVWKGRSIC